MRNLILIILVTASVSASGQGFLGLKGGPNFTNISSNSFPDTDSRTGFSGGVSYEYFLARNHSLSCDLLYNQRGYTIKDMFYDPAGNPPGQPIYSYIYVDYDYISLPIKTGIYVGHRLNLFGNIGIVPSLLVSSRTVTPTVYSGGHAYIIDTIDFTRNAANFDLAGLIEIGTNFKASDEVWIFGAAAYQYSLTTIANSGYFSDTRHYGLAISFGVKYRLPKAG